MTWIDDVLGLWFDEVEPKDWWSAATGIDDRIRERFGALQAALADHPPDVAPLDARGHLAVVIVFDQFPRNLYRGSPRAFATDGLALATALDAIDRGMDASLTRSGRQFLYMPLMHAEDAQLQRRSVELFTRLGDRQALRSATAHRETIERFGRFPHRNGALGRASTAEERSFLAEQSRPA